MPNVWVIGANVYNNNLQTLRAPIPVLATDPVAAVTEPPARVLGPAQLAAPALQTQAARASALGHATHRIVLAVPCTRVVVANVTLKINIRSIEIRTLIKLETDDVYKNFIFN